MSEHLKSPESQEQMFREFLIEDYLRYGSVDTVYRVHRFNLPIAYASYQRLLDQWGIVKAAGPHAELPLVLSFLKLMAQKILPLETLYRENPRFWYVSLSTMHRVYTAITQGVTRRFGTALVISPQERPDLILAGRETTANPALGKHIGSLTIPMTYSKRRESPQDSILRVLQQEALSSLAVTRSLPAAEIIPDSPSPLMTINIADVRVRVFSLALPASLRGHLSSFKLDDLGFINAQEVAAGDPLDSPFRTGVPEIAAGYLDPPLNQHQEAPHYTAHLNQALALAYV